MTVVPFTTVREERRIGYVRPGVTHTLRIENWAERQPATPHHIQVSLHLQIRAPFARRQKPLPSSIFRTPLQARLPSLVVPPPRLRRQNRNAAPHTRDRAVRVGLRFQNPAGNAQVYRWDKSRRQSSVRTRNSVRCNIGTARRQILFGSSVIFLNHAAAHLRRRGFQLRRGVHPINQQKVVHGQRNQAA